MTRRLERLVFPPLCRHCGASFHRGLSNILCEACFDSVIPDRDPRCLLCAKPLPPAAYNGSLEMRCADCRDRKSPLASVRCFASYEGALRVAHHAFKFEGMPSLEEPLGAMLSEVVPRDRSWWGSVLVPVPLSPDRERERGYNPALRLSRVVSRRIGLPVIEVLEKVRSTPPQMSLPRVQRTRNLKDAYSVKSGLEVPERAVLVDDVTTTGSTLEECAYQLRDAGTLEIRALVLGRTTRILE